MPVTARRDPRLFDPDKPLVMARTVPLYDHDMIPGDRLRIVDEPSDGKGEITRDLAVRLWLNGTAVYADDQHPTAIETPEEHAARVVEMDDLGGGWFMIRAPWLGEGLKVQGRDAADKRRAEIVDKGDTKGVTTEATGGGWYAISAPWLDEPVKVQGGDAAAAREAEIIGAGPPPGWRRLTAEEIAEAAEQQRLLADARRIAEEQAAEAARRDEEEAARQREAATAAAEEAERVAAAERERVAQTQGGTSDEMRAAGDAATGSQDVSVPSADFRVEEAGSNGWFQITGDTLAEPIRIRGREKADAKVAELRAAADTPTAAENATGVTPADAVDGAANEEGGETARD